MSPATALDHPLCSVIIVNYNGRHLLEECLTSVLAQAYPSFEIVLVDNGSSDGSAPFVRERFPDVRLVEAGENLGFAGGNNLGVERSTGEYVVLLNNDTIVAPGWLSALVDALLPPDVACASSLVRTDGIPDRYYEKNGSMNVLFLNIMRVYEKPENIFYGGGASLAFKRSILDIPFDPDYFAYVEDVYLGLRARFRGFRVVHANPSVVRHLGGATARNAAGAFVTYLQERNRVLTLLLFFSWGTILRAIPFLLLNAAARVLAGCFSRRRSLTGILRAYVWLATHPRRILAKRRTLRAERTVPDADVLGWMTGKLLNDETKGAALVNGLALMYCRIVGLRTIERLPPGSR
jgi:GT2 family glycosyltransferase